MVYTVVCANNAIVKVRQTGQGARSSRLVPANMRHRHNVGPASETVNQHWSNIGSMYHAVWVRDTSYWLSLTVFVLSIQLEYLLDVYHRVCQYTALSTTSSPRM